MEQLGELNPCVEPILAASSLSGPCLGPPPVPALSGGTANAADAAQTPPNSAPGQGAGSTTTVSEIVVTGSSIKRVDTETASPVQVISHVELQRSGYDKITQVLTNITANGAGTLERQQLGGLRGRRRGRRAARPVGRRDPDAGRRPSPGALSAVRRRRAPVHRHPEHPLRRGRSGRSAEGRRLGHLRLRRDRRRGEHHPEEADHRLRGLGRRRHVRARRRRDPALSPCRSARAISRRTATTPSSPPNTAARTRSTSASAATRTGRIRTSPGSAATT